MASHSLSPAPAPPARGGRLRPTRPAECTLHARRISTPQTSLLHHTLAQYCRAAPESHSFQARSQTLRWQQNRHAAPDS